MKFEYNKKYEEFSVLFIQEWQYWPSIICAWVVSFLVRQTSVIYYLTGEIPVVFKNGKRNDFSRQIYPSLKDFRFSK